MGQSKNKLRTLRNIYYLLHKNKQKAIKKLFENELVNDCLSYCELYSLIMAGVKALVSVVALAFLGSVGLTFLFLACALPGYNWWPFFVVIFYLLSPIPTLIAKRHSDGINESSALKEACAFSTTGIVLSAFGLPLVLARAPVAAPIITWASCGLVFTSNIVIFLAILGFFIAFDNDDGLGYSNW